jgi:hypothetical protein
MSIRCILQYGDQLWFDFRAGDRKKPPNSVTKLVGLNGLDGLVAVTIIVTTTTDQSKVPVLN